LWWSDERFLPLHDKGRNDFVVQAGFNFKTKIHRYPAPEIKTTIDLTQAAAIAQTELQQTTTSRFCDRNVLMDICLLSIGSDGHIASLFPDHPALKSNQMVIGITDSPKLPAQRMTWTLPTINASEQIWLIASGKDKSNAVTQLISGDDQLPAKQVSGKLQTRLFTAELL